MTQDHFPNLFEYQNELSKLRTQYEFIQNEENVFYLEKKVIEQDNTYDPLLKQFQQSHAQVTQRYCPASAVMQKVERTPKTDEEKFILNWRHSMEAVGFDLSLDVVAKQVMLDGDIPATMYRPAQSKDKVLPAIVYYHGGGFIGGSIQVTENFIRLLAQYANAAVFSIDYHYAPEFKAIYTTNEAYQALLSIQAHHLDYKIQKDQIAVLGESSGANLAIAVTQLDIQHQTHFVKNLVIGYPIITLDLDQGSTLKNPEASGKEVGAGDISFEQVMKLIGDAYVDQNMDRKDALVSPMNMDAESVAQFPPTFIITDEIDPLRYHGAHFAKFLAQSKVSVHHVYYHSVPHAFLNDIGIIPQAQDCAWEVSLWLNR